MRKKWLILCLGVALGLAACGSRGAQISELPAEQEIQSNTLSTVENQDASGQQEAKQQAGQQETNRQETKQQTGQQDTKQQAKQDTIQQADLLQQFLAGEVAAEVEDDFVDLSQYFLVDYEKDHSYTLNQLIEKVHKADEYEILGNTTPVVYYAMFTGAPGEDAKDRGMAVAVDFENPYETNRLIYVVKEDEGELELTLAIDAWSRRWPTVNSYGVIFDSGSGGAAYHSGSTHVPDDFEYHELEAWQQVGAGFTFDSPALDFSGGEIMDTVNAIINEWSEQVADSEKSYEVFFTQNIIGDRIYYAYYTEDESIAELMEELAGKHNFRFDTKAEIDAARADRAKSLDAELIYENYDEVKWVKRKDS